ncbi:MAG: radical SAM protein [Candidatus Thorarchaeota archaeon]
MVEYVRISLGTALLLGLLDGTPPGNFATVFLMTYNEEGCRANCAFCPQALESSSSPEMLSRIGWPQYRLKDVVDSIPETKGIQRICIQSLNYPNAIQDVKDISKRVRSVSDAPMSTCIHPISKKEMSGLKRDGINNIGIAIDACTPGLFDSVKGVFRNGPYSWESHFAAIRNAQQVFGKSNVTTHLIIGLGESEEDAARFLFRMNEMGVKVGLFAFTSIKGTAFEQRHQPDLKKYRRIQALRHLISQGRITEEDISFDHIGVMKFKSDPNSLRESLSSGGAFRVTGCPGCNRPYYNERPKGPMFNYPRPLTDDELAEALKDTGLVN